MAAGSETLHVVLSLSAPGLLREALKAAGRRERVVGFTDALALGPINPPSPRRRARWFAREMPEDWIGGWDWLPQSVYAFWREALKPGRRRIVWTSSRVANEQAAFLACVERFGGAPFEVIDLADVEVEVRFDDGRTRREKAVTLGMLSPETIVREGLWDLARPLTSTARHDDLEAWRKLKAEDTLLRVLGPSGLRSAPIDHFDEALLSYASKEWLPASSIIGHKMAGEYDDFLQAGDLLLWSRLEALIGDGWLEARPRPTDSQGKTWPEGMPLALRTEVRLKPDG